MSHRRLCFQLAMDQDGCGAAPILIRTFNNVGCSESGLASPESHFSRIPLSPFGQVFFRDVSQIISPSRRNAIVITCSVPVYERMAVVYTQMNQRIDPVPD